MNAPIPLRTERTGRVTLAGPLRPHLSVAAIIARDIGMILFVAGCVTVVVALAAGDGFGVSVPVEDGDRVRGSDVR